MIDLKDLAAVLSQLLQMKLGVCGNALVFFLHENAKALPSICKDDNLSYGKDTE